MVLYYGDWWARKMMLTLNNPKPLKGRVRCDVPMYLNPSLSPITPVKKPF